MQIDDTSPSTMTGSPALRGLGARRGPVLIGGVWILALLAIGAHYAPVPFNAKTAVAALALIAVCGLGCSCWLPPSRWDLFVAVTISAGFAVNIIVSSALLAVRIYTPDRAAMVAGAIGCLSASIWGLWGRRP
jgi:hypothetical protein